MCLHVVIVPLLTKEYPSQPPGRGEIDRFRHCQGAEVVSPLKNGRRCPKPKNLTFLSFLGGKTDHLSGDFWLKMCEVYMFMDV